MTVLTHDSKWRVLVGAAPLLGVAFLVVAAVQGEAEVAKSPTVQGILAAVAALGMIVSAWTAYRLRAAPAVAVAQAQAGMVALRGRAQALPGAPPLISPGGEACLWFKYGETFAHHYSASDSVRPFLLVDDSGSCIVLPAGADITGSGRPGPAPVIKHLPGATDITGSADLTRRERLLREGEQIHVVGRFIPVSAEAMDRQVQAGRLVEQTELPNVVSRSGDPAAFERMRATPPPPLPASPPPATPVALPVVGAPGGAAPFVISIGSSEGEAGLYGLLAVVDGLVLAGAGGMYWWLTHSSH